MGVVMAVHPLGINLRFAHVHLNLLGWMSMLIFGVGYHILPRFAGKTLYSNRLAEIQFWLANIGLIGMVLLSMADRMTSGDPLYPLFVLSTLLELLAIFIFGYNIIMTLFVDRAEG
jgi:cbb3-type cytochrome oxidase subunit 1